MELLHRALDLPILELNECQTILCVDHVLSLGIFRQILVQLASHGLEVILVEVAECDSVLRVVFVGAVLEVFQKDLEAKASILKPLHFKEHISTEEQKLLFVCFWKTQSFVKSLLCTFQVFILIGQHPVKTRDLRHHFTIRKTVDEFLANQPGLFHPFQGRVGHDRAEHDFITLGKIPEFFNNHVKSQDRLPEATGIGGRRVTGGQTHLEVTAPQTVEQRSIVVRSLFKLSQEFLISLEPRLQFVLRSHHRTLAGSFKRLLELRDLLLLQLHDLFFSPHHLVGAECLTVVLGLHQGVPQLQANVVNLDDTLTLIGNRLHRFSELAGLFGVTFGDIELGGHQCGLDTFSRTDAVSDHSREDLKRLIDFVFFLIVVGNDKPRLTLPIRGF